MSNLLSICLGRYLLLYGNIDQGVSENVAGVRWMNDGLSADSITNNLGTVFIGRRVICYSSLDSTNIVAKQEALRGGSEGTAIIARRQLAGRGRLGRSWLSPEGSISLSVILYPPLACLHTLIMISSLALANSIGAVTGLKAEIKWPNDIMLRGGKVSGILIESSVSEGVVDYAVIGIGVNVNLHLRNFPEIADSATSLSDELGREIPVLYLVRIMLVEIEHQYLNVLGGGDIYAEWRSRLINLGQQVSVQSGDSLLEGIAESVSRNGSLLVRKNDGSLETVIAGDVNLVQY